MNFWVKQYVWKIRSIPLLVRRVRNLFVTMHDKAVQAILLHGAFWVIIWRRRTQNVRYEVAETTGNVKYNLNKFGEIIGWWVPYETHVIWGEHINLLLHYYVLLGWVPYGTHVIWGQDIDLVVDYVLLGWWVPYGTHVTWGQHINLMLHYNVLLGWWVPYGTHVIWGAGYWPRGKLLCLTWLVSSLWNSCCLRGSILTSSRIIMSYLGGEFLMELMLTWVVSSLWNSCYLRAAYWPRAKLLCLTWVASSLWNSCYPRAGY